MRVVSPRLLAIALVPAALAAVALGTSWPEPAGPDFVFWLVACAAGELLWVRLPGRATTMNMSLACNLAALALLPRGQAMLAALIATLLAEKLFMRKPVVRCVFNASQTALAVWGASLALHAVAGQRAFGAGLPAPLALAGLGAAALVYFAVNSAAVAGAIAAADSQRFAGVWRSIFATRFNLFSTSALFSLGALVAVAHSLAGPVYSLLGAMPLLVTYAAYRLVYEAKPAARDEGSERRAA
jgi:hypothetical protein